MLCLNYGEKEEPWVLCRNPKVRDSTPENISLISIEFLNLNRRRKVQLNYEGPLTLLRPSIAHTDKYKGLSNAVYNAGELETNDVQEELIEGSTLPLILSPIADRKGNPITDKNAISLITLGKNPGSLRDKFRIHYIGPLAVCTYEQALDSGNTKLIESVQSITRDLTMNLRGRRNSISRNSRRVA